jgi:hypothetical protein
MPAEFDGRQAAGEPLAGWTLVGIGGPSLAEVILAEETELLVGRGYRPGSGGGEAGFQTGRHCLAVVVAYVCHGIARTAQDFLSLQRHRAEPVAVAWLVGHIVGDNELVLRVDRRLHVVAALCTASFPALHRTALWGRAGEVFLAAGLSLGLKTFREERALLERCALRLDIVCDCTAGGPRILVGVPAVKCRERVLDALVELPVEPLELAPGEVALFGVDRFALAAVNGDELTRKEVQLLAEQRARTADLPDGLQVVLTEVRHRLVIKPQLLQQPHQCDIPVGRLCQATTRTETVERAINVELQQSRRVIGRPSCSSRLGPLQAQRLYSEVVDKGINETDGILYGDVVVEPLWELALFVAVSTLDMTHVVRDSKVDKAGYIQNELYYSKPLSFHTVWRCT